MSVWLARNGGPFFSHRGNPMRYSTEDLQKMTKADLASILMNDFGKVPADSAKKDDLVEMVLEAQGADNKPDNLLDGNESAAPVVNNDEPQRKQGARDPEGRTWIKIHNDEHDTNDVFLCHNGDTCVIKREHWVKVKNKFIMGPLNDAVMTMYRDNGIGHQKRRLNVTVWDNPGDPVDSGNVDQVISPLLID